MYLFTIVDRKFFTAVITLVCVFSIVAFPMTVSAAESNFTDYEAAYDCNKDGVVDESDVEMMKDALLSGSDSGYHVCDVIRASRISQATAHAKTYLAPPLKEFLVSDMEVCEANDWFHRNFLMSDFDLVVNEDNVAIYFEFWDEGITYYSIEWTKGVNVVYNVELTPDECLVSTDIADVTFKIFVQDSKYVLDVVDRPISIYHFPVDTFDVNEANTWFHINTLMSDFDKEIQEDSNGIKFILKEDGKPYYSIEWTKDLIVYDEYLGHDYIVSYDDDDTWYQVFIRDDKYMLNIVDHPPYLAPPLALIDFTEGPVSDSDIQSLNEFFGTEWDVVSVKKEQSYFEFYFTGKNSYADYIARIPICEDPEIGKYFNTLNVIANPCVEGESYVVFYETLSEGRNLVQLIKVR